MSTKYELKLKNDKNDEETEKGGESDESCNHRVW